MLKENFKVSEAIARNDIDVKGKLKQDVKDEESLDHTREKLNKWFPV